MGGGAHFSGARMGGFSGARMGGWRGRFALLVLREWESPVQAGSLVQAGLLGQAEVIGAGRRVGWQLEPGILAGGRTLVALAGVGAGVALAAATWPYYGGYGYSNSCVQWVPDYGWVNVCNYPAYGGYGYY